MFEQDASMYEVPADIVSELNTAKYTEGMEFLKDRTLARACIGRVV